MAAVVHAQSTVTQVPLNYNFNGIVHAGESGLPDDPAGFRSISDRALDFSGGVPTDPILAAYQIVATAGALDIVHLGNRNLTNGGTHAFDPAPDGDNVGIQPVWLTNPDQTTPQTTTLAVPVPLDTPTRASFIYQISNGGGAFDIRFDFAGGGSTTATVSGGDWFGGTLPGAGMQDAGLPDNNLSVTEAIVDLSAHLGEVVTAITFENASNASAGYAILGANFTSDPTFSTEQQIPLAYNFNGIVHAGEAGVPDDPVGFRAISDRALDFGAGVPNDPMLADFLIVDQPGALDIVHLGNRNTVNGGAFLFDAAPDGDDVGTQPLWLANPDQTTFQTTALSRPITLDAVSRARLLYQISNGGGTFDVVFSFQSGGSFTTTVTGGDWFGGTFAGTAGVDQATPGANLSLTERSIDLSGSAGEIVTAISFGNASNANAGYAILAANISGCLTCPNAGAVTNLGGGSGPTFTTTGRGALGCDFDLTVDNGPAGATGSILIGYAPVSVPLNLVFPACTSTLHVGAAVATVPAPLDGRGRYALLLPGSTDPVFCGLTLYAQYGQLQIGPACPVLLSDGLSVTFGS